MSKEKDKDDGKVREIGVSEWEQLKVFLMFIMLQETTLYSIYVSYLTAFNSF